MKLRNIAAVLIAILYLQISAQPLNKPKLDSLFDRLEKNNRAMGTLVISKNGKTVYQRSTGYCDFRGDVKKPCTDATRYRIGSISKMFTAVMIFQLIEEGKLSAGTTIGSYFPNMPNAGKITVGHLLGHRSGLYNFTNDSTYPAWLSRHQTKQEMLAIMARRKPDFEPGEKAAYSNTNYVLLGYLIENITGLDYAENLKQRISARIGLRHTYYGGKTDPSKNESISYTFASTWEPDTETDMSIPGGAGAVISKPDELCTFIEALFNGKLVSPASLAQMTSITDGYGMGVFRMPFHTKKAFGHNGGIDGFSSSLGYFPDDSLAVAYCSNGMNYSTNQVMLGVLSIYFNMPYRLPEFSTYKISEGALDQYLGVYASKQLPLKIMVTRRKSTLVAQATGQPAFPLEPAAPHRFRFEEAGVQMDFDPAKKQLILQQGGGSFLFTREN